MPNVAHDVSPDPIVNAILAYEHTAAIRAAIELDVFTAIGDGATAKALAAKMDASERGLRILCDNLTVHGFLTKSGQQYGLTPSAAAFLDSRSPSCLSSIAGFLASPEMIGMFLDNPAGYVRNGGSEGLANVAADNPVWVKFAAAMVPFMSPIADGVAAEIARGPKPPRKVLDIAAGHGMFGIAIARAVPSADIVAVDWEAVLALARRNADAAGIGARYATLPGSAFDVDWGAGYDLILLPNFLHHFDTPTCASLLRKVRASLSPEGRAVAVEFVPNNDRVSPPFPAHFAFIMLATTPAGDAYTAGEFDDMARDAGFRGASVRPLPPSPASLVTFER